MEDPDPYDSRLDPCMTSIYHRIEQIYEMLFFFITGNTNVYLIWCNNLFLISDYVKKTLF